MAFLGRLFVSKQTSPVESRGISKFSSPTVHLNGIISKEEIEIRKELGKGAYGVVYMGKLRGKTVAIKCPINQALEPTVLRDLVKEVEIMGELRHPNVLLFMGVCLEPGNLMIITELMPRGSLFDLLHDDKRPPLSFRRKMTIAKQIAEGMNCLHMHSPPFIHRDLKSANVLVDNNWVVKVCDFGLTTLMKKSDTHLSGAKAAGTPLWMAPECLLQKPYGLSADVYSFGIILWELVTECRPFEDVRNLKELRKAVCVAHKRPKLPSSTPLPLREVITRCWSADPDGRPSFGDLISRFDEIIVDVTLSLDKSAREFWFHSFPSKFDGILFEDFKTALYNYFGEEEMCEGDEENIAWEHLHEIMSEEKTENKEVSLESFSSALSWFGPLHSVKQLVCNIASLSSQLWFHGPISKETAYTLLQSRPDGTFLVRYSGELGSYTISTRTTTEGEPHIKHFRIHRDKHSQYILGDIVSSSISNIIDTYSTKLGLLYPLPRPTKDGGCYAHVRLKDSGTERKIISPFDSVKRALALVKSSGKGYWLILGYDEKGKCFAQDSGSSGIEHIIDHIDSNKIQYAVINLGDKIVVVSLVGAEANVLDSNESEAELIMDEIGIKTTLIPWREGAGHLTEKYLLSHI